MTLLEKDAAVPWISPMIVTKDVDARIHDCRIGMAMCGVLLRRLPSTQ